MQPKELNKIEDFLQGDIIQVVSHESNCGIDETVFTALVVETKEDGLIAIPQDFTGHILNAVRKGADWVMSVDWLLENDVKVLLLQRYSELLDARWT